MQADSGSAFPDDPFLGAAGGNLSPDALAQPSRFDCLALGSEAPPPALLPPSRPVLAAFSSPSPTPSPSASPVSAAAAAAILLPGIPTLDIEAAALAVEAAAASASAEEERRRAVAAAEAGPSLSVAMALVNVSCLREAREAMRGAMAGYGAQPARSSARRAAPTLAPGAPVFSGSMPALAA